MGRKGFKVGTAGGGRKGDSLEYIKHVPKFLRDLKEENVDERPKRNEKGPRSKMATMDTGSETKQPLHLGAGKIEQSDGDDDIEEMKRAGFRVEVLAEEAVEAGNDVTEFLERARNNARSRAGNITAANFVAERIEKRRREVSKGPNNVVPKVLMRDGQVKPLPRKVTLSFQDSDDDA